MRVIYTARGAQGLELPTGADEPVLELRWNDWDDFGYKTTLRAVLHAAHGKHALDSIKVLVAEQLFTADWFETLVAQGWDGVFPPPGADYVSNPTSLAFWDMIIGEAGQDDALQAADLLRDASRLTRLFEDPAAMALVAGHAFGRSLLRERGDQQAFNHGWKLLGRAEVAIEDFTFGFRGPDGEAHRLALAFSQALMPRDINVVIGPNGAGKSQLLNQLVAHWLQVAEESPGIGFAPTPNINQVVAISYSPFEQLRVDTAGLELADVNVYRYFGLRGREPSETKLPGTVTLSLNHARTSAVAALIDCVADDQRYSMIAAWSRKVTTLHEVLRTGIGFDFAAVEVPVDAARRDVQQVSDDLDDPIVDFPAQGEWDVDRRFVRIDRTVANNLDVESLKGLAMHASGVHFFRDGRLVQLSSGQRLFAYIVVNLLGSIRRHSLVLIDEPELFLHPSLEISLVSMLKSILAAYASKALIATHSLVVVRECPRECVHVFEPTPEGLVIKHPPFQTFGGDIQRISSYVFGDKAISKPFERWIDESLGEFETREELLARLAPEDLNEELILELGARARPLA